MANQSSTAIEPVSEELVGSGDEPVRLSFEHKRRDLVSRPEATSAVDVAVAAAMAGAAPTAVQPRIDHRPWGSPVSEVVPTKNEDRSTGENSNSWGRTDSIAYTDRPHEMARVQLDEGQTLQLMIQVNQKPGQGFVGRLGGTDSLTVWCRVTVGSGSSSVDKLIRCDSAVSLPFSCTYLQISAYVGDLQGRPVAGQQYATPPDVAQVAVQIARCTAAVPVLGDVVFETDAGSTFALNGQLAQRLVGVQAHLQAATAGVAQWIQLFDQPTIPTNGDVPIYEAALGALPEESAIGDGMLIPGGLPISQGLWASVSTTSGVLAISAASAWVQVRRSQV